VKDFQLKHQCSQTESEKFYLSDMVNKNQRELEKYSAWADEIEKLIGPGSPLRD